MSGINRQWIVAQASTSGGIGLERECFGQQQAKVPEPGPGEILIRNCYFSCDPMNHAWVKGLGPRFEPIPVGGVMRGGVAGRVMASKHPGFAPGDPISGFLDWADYTVSNGFDYTGTPVQRLPGDLPLAGGARKCSVVTGQLGADAVIDYQSGNLSEALADLCGEGINVFFDNVGSPILDAVLANLARGARIVICGGISGYNSPTAGLTNHLSLAIQGATMAGFFYFDHTHRLAEANERLAALLRAGSIRELLDVAEGFDAVPDAALGQFAGRNLGKQLVRIADDPGRNT